MTLPKIPGGKDWSEATWRAGLDKAVGLCEWPAMPQWRDFCRNYTSGDSVWHATIAHATTLIDAGIVKPVVSEAAVLLEKTFGGNAVASTVPFWKCPAAIAVIQDALDKARAGQ